MPPTSKKLPPVDAAPIRKKSVSVCAHAPKQTTKSKLAQANPRQQQLITRLLISAGETAMANHIMPMG